MTLAATSPTLFFALSEVVKVLFVFAFGACVGSLTNVLVYRLPLGLSVVSPPSRCPKCGTRLAWKDNIPVLGWVLLRGRCRYCKVKISPEYPLVEAFVGLVFVLAFGLCYLADNPLFEGARVLGAALEAMRPDWSRAGFMKTWPVFVTLLVLLSCLVAMYIIDARTYTIPLVLTWTPAVTAAVLLPLHAAWAPSKIRATTWAPGWSYAIATPGPQGWAWIGAGIGGMLGIGIGVLLLRLGLLKRSFADYDEWEAKHFGAAEKSAQAGHLCHPEGEVETSAKAESSADEVLGEQARSASGGSAEGLDKREPEDPSLTVGARQEGDRDGAAGTLGHQEGDEEKSAQAGRLCHQDQSGAQSQAQSGDRGATPAAAGPEAQAAPDSGASTRRLVIGACVVACAAIGALLWPGFGWIPLGGAVVGAAVGPAVAGVLLRLTGWGGGSTASEPEESPATEWLEYPHARREVLREVIFLAPCFALALLGAMLARQFAGPWELDEFMRLTPRLAAPLWLDVLGGVCLGYLVGGGVVWAIRILGSLLFGKEAMGLGDVHMMAGVGACLGWIDPTLAFFLAAFVGVYREIVSRLQAGPARRAMPFGPSLALATVIVLAGKPWIEQAINAWAKLEAERRVHLP